MHYFTADEHYGHKNIIESCKRALKKADEMDEALIKRHNEVVDPDDTVIHVGNFCMKKNRWLVESVYIKRLNGNHIFVRGAHDYWLDKDPVEIDTTGSGHLGGFRSRPGRGSMWWPAIIPWSAGLLGKTRSESSVCHFVRR